MGCLIHLNTTFRFVLVHLVTQMVVLAMSQNYASAKVITMDWVVKVSAHVKMEYVTMVSLRTLSH